MSVGVMKDYKLKQRNLRASPTLGWSWLEWNEKVTNDLASRVQQTYYPITCRIGECCFLDRNIYYES